MTICGLERSALPSYDPTPIQGVGTQASRVIRSEIGSRTFLRGEEARN